MKNTSKTPPSFSKLLYRLTISFAFLFFNQTVFSAIQGQLDSNASVNLLIENNTLAASNGGSYSGTLTLTMIPE
jgi:hypothetical protein